MSKYWVEHKNIVCTDVQWGDNIFTLVYKNEFFKYKLSDYPRFESDEKTIKNVIEIFLDEMSRKLLDHFCNVLSTIGEKNGELGEESYGKTGKALTYISVQRDMLSWVSKIMRYIESTPDNEE